MLWVNRIYLGFRGDGLPDRKVRELRIRAGKTQKEIADYLNISRSTYTLYESAKRQMSNETLCALAEYYGAAQIICWAARISPLRRGFIHRRKSS